jgi:hypothetical protein
VTNRRWGWGGGGKRKGKGWGNALFYPGVGDKRVNHEVTASGSDKLLWGRGYDERKKRGAYTWLRERESGERLKASDEGAGMMTWMS